MADIDKVIADNIGLVYKQLNRFKLQNDEDAYSWALEALWKAAETFNSSKGYAFSTYAMTCIYNGINMYIRSLNKQSKLDVISYDEYLNDEQETTFEQTLSHDNTPEKALIDKSNCVAFWKAFYDALDMCNDTGVAVVKYWKDSGFTANQIDIAKHLNISQPQVSRTLSAFKHKFKTRLEEYL